MQQRLPRASKLVKFSLLDIQQTTPAQACWRVMCERQVHPWSCAGALAVVQGDQPWLALLGQDLP